MASAPVVAASGYAAATAKPAQMMKQLVIKKIPEGIPSMEQFELETKPVPEPKEGEIVGEVKWLGFQPSMLKSIRGEERACMKDDIATGEDNFGVPPAYGVATVIAAGPGAKFEVGDLVWGDCGWRTHCVLTKEDRLTRKLNADYPHPNHFLSVFGVTSFTAFFGLELAKLKEGETVVVSAAMGAVGQAVVQLAKRAGCFVVGLVSSESKADGLKALGADKVVVTKNDKGDLDYDGLRAAMQEVLPGGKLDVFWDNVGGETLDVQLGLMKNHARVIVCGRISAFLDEPYRLRNYEQILVQQARMEGFLVTDYFPRFPEATGFFANLAKSGEFKVLEDVSEGLETCPSALAKLFNRTSVGKVLVKM